MTLQPPSLPACRPVGAPTLANSSTCGGHNLINKFEIQFHDPGYRAVEVGRVEEREKERERADMTESLLGTMLQTGVLLMHRLG